jgi:hypothetical protein
MTDTLLKNSHKAKIAKAITVNDYKTIVAILDSISTAHAGTAKMKDKRYVIKEILKHIANSNGTDKTYFIVGKNILAVKSNNAKEIGIHIIWRAYAYDKKSVEKYLYSITNDVNWEVREYAAGALGGTLEAFPQFYTTLKRWSKDKSENIRRGVVMSAIALKNTEGINKAFKLLEPMMYDSSPYVKKNLGPFILGSYFGNAFPKETIKQMNKWLSIKDENVRWNIAMAFNNSFGNRFPGEAVKFLKKLNADNNPVVVRAVKSTLNHLKKRQKSLKV